MDEITENHRKEIKLALQALDKAFAQRTGVVVDGVPDRQGAAEWISDWRAAIGPLRQSGAHTLPASDRVTPAGPSNVLGFIGGLEVIASLLEPREPTSGSAIAEPTDNEPDSERPFFDPAAFRFSLKLGAAITLGLLVGLTTQRADLQTILWSTVVAGQPNQYGAVVRKTLLRLSGCIVGGLAALAAMILVSQNFDSLPPYLLAIFAVTMFSTYLAQSDEWLGYTGIQAGITFLICYVGLAPASDVYKPLWRFWGIVLGVLTTAFVFLVLWPEYASDKVIESLKKLMRTTLSFATEIAEGHITREKIAAVERRVSADLLEVLNLADQARFEGRRGTTNSAAAIDAASSIVRIAYRFRIIARGRIAEPPVPLSRNKSERQARFERACCAALETELARLGYGDSPDRLAPSSTLSAVDLAAMSEEFATAEIPHLSPENQIHLATQLESYRRLPVLLSSLDTSLSKIAVSTANQ